MFCHVICSLVLHFFCQSASGISTNLHHSPKQLWWMFQWWSKDAIIAFLNSSCGLPLFCFMAYPKFFICVSASAFSNLLFLLLTQTSACHTHAVCAMNLPGIFLAQQHGQVAYLCSSFSFLCCPQAIHLCFLFAFWFEYCDNATWLLESSSLRNTCIHAFPDS